MILITKDFIIKPIHLNNCDDELANNLGIYLTDNLFTIGDKNNNSITDNITIFFIILINCIIPLLVINFVGLNVLLDDCCIFCIFA